MVGLYTVGAVTVPVMLSPLLARLSGGCSSYVYSLMYRYICIDFGYLSVIVSFTGLIFSGSQLNWLELAPIPHHRESDNMSLFSFPPSFRVSSSSPQHLISRFAFSCHVRSQAPCRSVASGRALPRADDPASGPPSVLALRLKLKVRD